MANAWKIARKSSAQLPLVIVIALAVVLVLLGKANSGIFDQARMRITDWMAPALEAARSPVQGVGRWMGSITEIFSVYEHNLRLKEENARLRQWRNVAIVLQNRVDRYQALLHAVPDPKMNAVLARVIGRASRPFLQTMVLDAGKDDNARPGQAVMDARGMIGRIYLTGERTSWVILLTDLNSRIPVSIASSVNRGNAVQAIMTGDNTAMPTLAMVPGTVTLHAGDQVTSSGDGGLLPAGLPIGTVVADGAGGRGAAGRAPPAGRGGGALPSPPPAGGARRGPPPPGGGGGPKPPGPAAPPAGARRHPPPRARASGGQACGQAACARRAGGCGRRRGVGP